MKKSMILIMAVLLVLCWYTTVGSWMSNGKNYQEAMDNAAFLEEQELYLDAIEEYQNAMQYQQDTSGIMLLIAYDYRKMGDDSSYLQQLKNIVKEYGPVEEAVSGIYEYYQEKNRVDDAVEYIADLKEKYPDDKTVKGYYQQVQKSFYGLYQSWQQLGSFQGSYAVYEYEGKKGIIDTAGEVVLKAVYDEVSIPEKSSDGFAVSLDGKSYVVSEKGYKIIQPNENYEMLGSPEDGRILAKRDGKFGYLNTDYQEKTDFIWEDATNFYHKVAAVQKDGKWALINIKGELLTDYVYTDVKRDTNNFCSRSGLLWVNEGNGYRLLNTELEIVSEDLYEDVKCFLTDDICAVAQNGRWGFCSKEGELVIDYLYDDADSFTIGYAPVKKEGLWGYIGKDGVLLIDRQFDEAECFNADGTAPVKMAGSWTLIKLSIYK